MKLKKVKWETNQVYKEKWATRFSWSQLVCGIDCKMTKVDAQLNVSLLRRNYVFFSGTIYLNAYMVNNISLDLLIGIWI
jgi:hypothetical protein